MWIGTADGLVRYDGSQVVVFQNDPNNPSSISGNNISVMETEGDSILWVGTYQSGLNKLNLNTETFERFVPRQGNPNCIPSKEIYALEHDSRGDLWIGYNRDGFGRYHPEDDSFEVINITVSESSFSNRQNNVVKNFIADKFDPDILWVVSLRSLIEYHIHSGAFKRHNPYSSDPNRIENKLFAIFQGVQAADGLIYLSCDRYGVWEFNPANATWKNFLEKSTDINNRYRDTFVRIESVAPHIFWLSRRKGGIYVLNTLSGSITPFQETEKEASNPLPLDINAWSLKSPEGYWLGTNNGVLFYNKQANQFETVEFQPNAKWLKNRLHISVIYPVNAEEVYFGGYAGDGIYRYNLKTQQKDLISPPESILKSESRMFSWTDFAQKNDSTLLVLAYDVLYELNLRNEQLTKVPTGLKFGKDYYLLSRIMKASNGDYHISTRYSGVYTLDSNLRVSGHIGYDPDKPQQSLVNSNYIYRICEDPDHSVWIGTENGFSRWNPKDNSFTNFNGKSRSDSTPTLKTIYRILLAPDSSLWFIDAFDNGVYLEYPYEMPYQFKPVLTGNQGRMDRLKNVLFLQNGKTLIATETGLSIVEKNGNIRRFTKSEGLPSLSTLVPMVEMADGRIVVSSGNKLVSFYPDSLYYTPKKNELSLRSINIFDKTLDANIDSIMRTGLTLDYLQNFFTFNLSLLNFDNPEEYKLSYRLQGFSKEWTTTPNKSAVFTNVPGGQYTFQARLIDKNNQVAQDILTLPVEMIPPLSKIWWFQLLMATLTLGIVLYFIVIRFRSIRRKAAFTKELAHMEMVSLRAQMNPHFIFNSLNSIRHQIISKKNDEAEVYLVKFSRLIRWILENSETQYITLKDELVTLRLYLELESKRFDEKFEYHLNVDPTIDTKALKVPGIIVQPFVENAIWHGLMQKRQAGTVVIDLWKTDKNLIITITDDGIGREKALEIKSKTGLKQNSMGVKITTARLKAIEKLYHITCSTDIEDLKDASGVPKGTRVTLTLPLIHNFTLESELNS